MVKKDWQFLEEGSNMSKYESDECTWAKKYTQRNQKSIKTIFYCRRGSAVQCPIEIRVEEVANGRFRIYSHSSHNSECMNLSSASDSKNIKKKVILAFESGIHRPWEVKRSLASQGLTVRSEQIYYMLNNKKSTFPKCVQQ